MGLTNEEIDAINEQLGWGLPQTDAGISEQLWGCEHTYVQYTGLIETYQYCSKCDAKA